MVLYDQCEVYVKPCMTTPLQTFARLALFCSLFVSFWAEGPPTAGDRLVKPIHVTDGGLGGVVLRVTTLASDGDGSLRAALDDPRPRLVVFEVGGVIDLQGHALEVRHPYLTLAGETAPDPGITLVRGELDVATHDVVIEHLAVRPGDNGRAKSSTAWAPDALGAHRGSYGPVHDVVFDHCSATWAVDENLSASGPADVDPDRDPEATSHDITMRHCLIAEGLSHATHPKGEHSKGTLVHDGVRNVTITGCLYAHNTERNPRLKGSTTATVTDNVMYNWAAACVGVGSRGNKKVLKPSETILTGNLAIAGPDTRFRALVKELDPGGRVFLRDNLAVDAKGSPLPLMAGQTPEPSSPVAWQSALRVLRTAGARPARRDPIDARIVQSVIRGEGHIINSQEDVGGYPVRPSTSRKLTAPEGLEARRRWLAALAKELDEDKALDVAPLRKRLGRS